MSMKVYIIMCNYSDGVDNDVYANVYKTEREANECCTYLNDASKYGAYYAVVEYEVIE